jgi:hypothetical protein
MNDVPQNHFIVRVHKNNIVILVGSITLAYEARLSIRSSGAKKIYIDISVGESSINGLER